MMRKLLVVIAISLLVSSFFVAKVPITPEMAIVSSLFVIVFALPSYAAALRLLGKRKGLAALAVFGLYGLFIESLALRYGFPYGSFTYTDILGTKLFDLTPWTVAFAYPPILLLAYAFARRHTESVLPVLIITALLATAVDTVLDPAAVRLGFWYWDDPGLYYGVPFINFIGWLGSSFIGGGLVHAFFKDRRQLLPGLALSGTAILLFWTLVNAWFGQWLAVIFGTALAWYFVSHLRYDEAAIRHHLRRRRPVRPSTSSGP